MTEKRFFTEDQIQSVWDTALMVEGTDSTIFRKDACGAWIKRDMYGVQDSDFGWEIDHIFPVSLGGGDDAENLRALQHQNNASKGNDYPSYEAVVTSDGIRNVESRHSLIVNEKVRVILKKLYKNA